MTDTAQSGVNDSPSGESPDSPAVKQQIRDAVRSVLTAAMKRECYGCREGIPYEAKARAHLTDRGGIIGCTALQLRAALAAYEKAGESQEGA